MIGHLTSKRKILFGRQRKWGCRENSSKVNYNFFLVNFVLRPIFLLCLNNCFPARLKFCRFSAKLESASSEFESQLSAQKVDFPALGVNFILESCSNFSGRSSLEKKKKLWVGQEHSQLVILCVESENEDAKLKGKNLKRGRRQKKEKHETKWTDDFLPFSRILIALPRLSLQECEMMLFPWHTTKKRRKIMNVWDSSNGQKMDMEASVEMTPHKWASPLGEKICHSSKWILWQQSVGNEFWWIFLFWPDGKRFHPFLVLMFAMWPTQELTRALSSFPHMQQMASRWRNTSRGCQKALQTNRMSSQIKKKRA